MLARAPLPSLVMLLLLCPLLAVAQAGDEPSEEHSFHYRRDISVSGVGPACAVLDPAIFAHAAPALRDLRLFSGQPAASPELPYALTVSETQQIESEPARVLNLGRSGNALVFDLAMPSRPYTDVVFDISAKDFLATAEVTGQTGQTEQPGAHPNGISLGQFTLFDLTAQHLARNTTLHLAESTFPFLHVRLQLTAAPGSAALTPDPAMVRAAAVPPSRERQTLFVTALSAQPQRVGKETVANFALPAHVPIERVLVTLPPQFQSNFSRDIRITARSTAEASEPEEVAAGTIERVHLMEAGQELRQQQMSVDAAIGSNLQSPAEVKVAVEDGDDAPLPIATIELQIRQRKICFNAGSPALGLFYGAPDLRAPHYDFGRTFSATERTLAARLGPEEVNPAWRPRRELRSFSEQHPHLIWVLLFGVLGLLGVIAFRSTRVITR